MQVGQEATLSILQTEYGDCDNIEISEETEGLRSRENIEELPERRVDATEERRRRKGIVALVGAGDMSTSVELDVAVL